MLPDDLKCVESVLTLDPASAESIAGAAGISLADAMIILSKLELEGAAKEVFPGYFVACLELA